MDGTYNTEVTDLRSAALNSVRPAICRISVLHRIPVLDMLVLLPDSVSDSMGIATGAFVPSRVK